MPEFAGCFQRSGRKEWGSAYLRTKLKYMAGIAAVAVMTAGLAAPASATESELDVLAAIQEAAPEVLEAVADVPTDAAGDVAVEVEATGTTTPVEIPVDPSEGIALGEGDEVIQIGLPNADDADNAVVEAPGVVSYDNGDGSTTVPVVKDDGSVQITTVIVSADAPTRYEYPLHTPEGATVTLDDATGAISFTAAEGTWIGGIAPAWAKDANGIDVPSRYELDGNTLTQVVEHDNESAYPVVADPWAGQQLISQAWVSSHSRGWVVNVNPTWWGRFYSGGVHLTAHWQELQNRLQTNVWRLTSTIREQFYCHVIGNLAEPGTYNMESWRPYKSWSSQLNLWDRCNP
ncbi:DUF2599 domain-containing protein [Luethyella okanaganae]|uniref:DUF2599 domain-containing protein n=1 Tax=Luethyella okanaganae TaxID=69372 RepID=A0ABW1VEI2_9MICO